MYIFIGNKIDLRPDERFSWAERHRHRRQGLTRRGMSCDGLANRYESLMCFTTKLMCFALESIVFCPKPFYLNFSGFCEWPIVSENIQYMLECTMKYVKISINMLIFGTILLILTDFLQVARNKYYLLQIISFNQD